VLPNQSLEPAIGVLISLEEPTRDMRRAAASAGFYSLPWGSYARVQLLTIAEILDGKRIEYPAITGGNRTLKAAPRTQPRVAEQLHAFDD
jgi:hypothetical protein